MKNMPIPMLLTAIILISTGIDKINPIMPKSEIRQTPKIITELLEDDGTFPNNARLPLIIYQGAIDLPTNNAASVLEAVFKKNNWTGSWRDGIYNFHHYHSTSHEVLGVYAGSATVQLGGPKGPEFRVNKGDVIIIPAGVAHKNLGQSGDFRVVGAYPNGRSYDMNYGKPGERPKADENINAVPLPDEDPIYGASGPLKEYWVEE